MSIEEKLELPNCPMVLPLVGEFSSGKTTLINALTDCKQLETSTKPTTSTIYEIHFGCSTSHAIVVDSEGNLTEVDDISKLKNESLGDAKIVTIFDTSNRVPNTTILVDTPGLSSPDPKHKQTLVDFLPNADAVLLVSDINQQITKSITGFIDTMSLAKRPIYVVLTKCDTKSSGEVETAKKYISENTKIQVEDIVCVSSIQNDLQELLNLFDFMQKNKNQIIKSAYEYRTNQICKRMQDAINNLISASHSTASIEDKIRESELKLNKFKHEIENLSDSISNDIEIIKDNSVRRFESIVFEKLDGLIAGRRTDYDAEAITIINNTSSLLLNEFCSDVESTIKQHAFTCNNENLKLDSLQSATTSDCSLSGLSYSLNLNEMGHQYDGVISTIVGTVAIAGAAYLAGNIAGRTVGSSLTNNSQTNGQADMANMMAADSVEDVALVGMGMYGSKMLNNIGNNSGLIQSIVGLVTDAAMGKPQRRKVIREYVDMSLVPSFRNEMSRNAALITRKIKEILMSEASENIKELTAALYTLKDQMNNEEDNYQKKIDLLQAYKTELENNK